MQYSIPAVQDGFITAVETFYHGDYDKQSKVLNEEVPKFRDKQGHYENADVTEIAAYVILLMY